MHKIFYLSTLLLMIFFQGSSFGQSGKNYFCSYKVADLSNETNLNFILPDNFGFGTLIPVELRVKNDPNSSVKMNTVVLKDKPYMVLSDVYKMQSKTSSMALMIFSPDGTSIDVAFINMGDKPSAKFFNGKCVIN